MVALDRATIDIWLRQSGLKRDENALHENTTDNNSGCSRIPFCRYRDSGDCRYVVATSECTFGMLVGVERARGSSISATRQDLWTIPSASLSRHFALRCRYAAAQALGVVLRGCAVHR